MTEKESLRKLEALEIHLLLTGVAERYGYDFRGYAPGSLTRRIRSAVAREGVPTISALQERVLRDPVSLGRMVETVSVHTTAMFRDPEFYRVLRQEVVPLLRTYPFARIWVAGCATGEEVYSLAIVLQEAGILERCRIYATDISDSALERARRGVFPLSALEEHTLAYKHAGGKANFADHIVTDSKSAIFRQPLRQQLVFSQHNLVSDSPFNEFQLVLCRNVAIYFGKELRQRVLELIHASLCKFGLLGLGMRESLRYTPLADAFQELPGGARLYRRIR